MNINIHVYGYTPPPCDRPNSGLDQLTPSLTEHNELSLARSSPEVAAGVSSSRDSAAILLDVTFDSCAVDNQTCT